MIIIGDSQLTVKVPLIMTDAKLSVLVEVAKAWGMELAHLIEDSIHHDMRALLEGSNDTGDKLNKIMCDTWLEEIGAPSEGNEAEKDK